MPFLVCLSVFIIFQFTLGSFLFYDLWLYLGGFMLAFGLLAAYLDLRSDKIFRSISPPPAQWEMIRLQGKWRYIFRSSLVQNVMIVASLFFWLLFDARETLVIERRSIVAFGVLGIILVSGNLMIAAAIWERRERAFLKETGG
jgi:hypothetical protein